MFKSKSGQIKLGTEAERTGHEPQCTGRQGEQNADSTRPFVSMEKPVDLFIPSSAITVRGSIGPPTGEAQVTESHLAHKL